MKASTLWLLFAFTVLLFIGPAEPAIKGRDTTPGMNNNESAVKELPPPSKRYALLIGVSEYERPDITSLPAAVNDADMLADALIKYAGFPKDNVIVLATNKEKDFQPEGYTIISYISRLAQIAGREQGLFLLSYSGHGYELDGQAFFLGSDARLEDDIEVLKRTCVSWADISLFVGRANVPQAIVLLDACRNNPQRSRGQQNEHRVTQIYERGLLSRKGDKQPKALLKMLSTQRGDLAYEDPESKMGFFTAAFVDGIKGAAADDNGTVTLAHLRTYLEDSVPARAKLKGKRQVPVIEVSNYDERRLVLAVDQAKSRVDAAALKSNRPKTDGTENLDLIELQEWIRTRRSQSVEDYRHFLEGYPGGNFAAEAKARIVAIEEAALENENWKKMAGSERLEDYSEFLKRHPNGIHAVEAAKKIRELESSQAKAKIRELEDAIRLNSKSQAVLTYPADAPEHPPGPDAGGKHSAEGDRFAAMKRFAQAESEYREAIKLSPENSDYYGKLGIALYHQGKLKDAEAQYRKANKLEPNNANWLFNLGLSLQRRQKYSDAEDTLRRAIKLNPGVADFHVSLCTVLALQGVSQKLWEAEVECQQAIKLGPNTASYHYHLGNVYVMRKSYRQGEAEYGKALQLEPHNEAYQEALRALKRTGN